VNKLLAWVILSLCHFQDNVKFVTLKLSNVDTQNVVINKASALKEFGDLILTSSWSYDKEPGPGVSYI